MSQYWLLKTIESLSIVKPFSAPDLTTPVKIPFK
jgi:hypothetical protein